MKKKVIKKYKIYATINSLLNDTFSYFYISSFGRFKISLANVKELIKSLDDLLNNKYNEEYDEVFAMRLNKNDLNLLNYNDIQCHCFFNNCDNEVKYILANKEDKNYQLCLCKKHLKLLYRELKNCLNHQSFSCDFEVEESLFEEQK